MISYEDICFFLEYIRQPYQPAEVYEMINLLSGDTMKVSLQDFMKIGLGTIVPLAAFKVPDTRSQTKQVILENVRQSELFQMEANEIVEAQREGIVS